MMALFDEAFIQEVGQLIRQQHHVLAQTLGLPMHTPKEAPREAPNKTKDKAGLDANAPLHRDLALLMDVANGKYLRAEASKAMLARVEAAWQRVVDLLFGNVMRTHVSIPDDFWPTDAGILLARARWWLSADELITISNAAALVYGENTQANRMRIARAMEKGVLTWVPDPSVANPQQNRRVLRPQVEQLLAQSTRPE